MEQSTVNIDNRLSAIDKANDASLGKSFPLWNDPTRNRKPSVTKAVEHLNLWRTHYPIERRSDNLFNRILRRIGLG
jgi:hypothetical protein